MKELKMRKTFYAEVLRCFVPERIDYLKERERKSEK